MRRGQSSFGLTALFTVFITLFKATSVVAQSAKPWKFKVLHTFHGKNGANPEAALIRDSAGNLYGSTTSGGAGTCSQYGCGTIFKLDKAGRQTWLYNFHGKDGNFASSPLLRAATGSLLGATAEGDLNDCGGAPGCGVVFRINGAGKKETVLHKFDGADGQGPGSPLTKDAAGNIYGTVSVGAADGAVYRLDKSGNETILYAFSGWSDGGVPVGGVVRDSHGNLYGVTMYGGVGFGNSGYGVVYEVDTAGNETVPHAFAGGSDGAYPASTLIFDEQGNLYGTTEGGGISECGATGCGTIFKLSPRSGGAWTESVLYAFCSVSGCADGEEPLVGPLVMDAAGELFGTTYFGGTDNYGVVFKLDTAGNETVLHSFSGGSDGAGPVAGLLIDNHRNLYGTTQGGGAICYIRYTCGVVFQIIP